MQCLNIGVWLPLVEDARFTMLRVLNALRRHPTCSTCH